MASTDFFEVNLTLAIPMRTLKKKSDTNGFTCLGCYLAGWYGLTLSSPAWAPKLRLLIGLEPFSTLVDEEQTAWVTKPARTEG